MKQQTLLAVMFSVLLMSGYANAIGQYDDKDSGIIAYKSLYHALKTVSKLKCSNGNTVSFFAVYPENGWFGHNQVNVDGYTMAGFSVMISNDYGVSFSSDVFRVEISSMVDGSDEVTTARGGRDANGDNGGTLELVKSENKSDDTAVYSLHINQHGKMYSCTAQAK
jgi:hypothetical protein